MFKVNVKTTLTNFYHFAVMAFKDIVNVKKIILIKVEFYKISRLLSWVQIQRNHIYISIHFECF